MLTTQSEFGLKQLSTVIHILSSEDKTQHVSESHHWSAEFSIPPFSSSQWCSGGINDYINDKLSDESIYEDVDKLMKAAPHTPTAADKIQFVIFVRSTKEFEKWFEFEVRLLNFRIYFFYNYMSQSHLSIYILLCSHIYKYRNMQVLFLMVKLPVNCSQLSNEKTLVVWGI